MSSVVPEMIPYNQTHKPYFLIILAQITTFVIQKGCILHAIHAKIPLKEMHSPPSKSALFYPENNYSTYHFFSFSETNNSVVNQSSSEKRTIHANNTLCFNLIPAKSYIRINGVVLFAIVRLVSKKHTWTT